MVERVITGIRERLQRKKSETPIYVDLGKSLRHRLSLSQVVVERRLLRNLAEETDGNKIVEIYTKLAEEETTYDSFNFGS